MYATAPIGLLDATRTTADDISNAILTGECAVLDARVHDEAVLVGVAERINALRHRALLLSQLIDALPEHGRCYDWNVGSILQHFEAKTVIAALDRVADQEKLLGSSGLAWVLGEFGSCDERIVGLLRLFIDRAGKSEAWWAAALSLENLGIDQAVALLKRSLRVRPLESLEYYLEHLDDKRSLIAILLLSTPESVASLIHPRLRQVFLSTKEPFIAINCGWLLCRFGLFDDEIHARMAELANDQDFQVRYCTLWNMHHASNDAYRPLFEDALNDADPLIRRLAARGLQRISDERSVAVLEKTLQQERDPRAIADISRAIAWLRNQKHRAAFRQERRGPQQENGAVSADLAADLTASAAFTAAIDPDRVVSRLVENDVSAVREPIFIGAGQVFWHLVDSLAYEGELTVAERLRPAFDAVSAVLGRRSAGGSRINIVRGGYAEILRLAPGSSSLIIVDLTSTLQGMTGGKLSPANIDAIIAALADDGVLYTIGGDETFSDDLARLWYRYAPDDARATDFDEWREKKSASFLTARGAGLAWRTRGVRVPLQFSSLSEAARVIGHLFGRDAAQQVVSRDKMHFELSLGITRDTKKDLARLRADRSTDTKRIPAPAVHSSLSNTPS